ncbi:SixA phosphatase family protein [Couchioplanes azureus]|uniref:SixA phosphatase family protein n=1 Tax=Couchioplanes caeruleus TaxID=56438 RepID=UPI00167089D7|nr:histidine phosphatase family protein [Couchioplanes caeruleus]
MTARTLVLMRHAKAEPPGELTDFARQLTGRGRADAGAAGAWLAAEGLRPGLVLCSSATRTRQTWHCVAVALGQADPEAPAPEVRYEDGLYAGGRTEVIDLLRAVPDSIGTVLVVGHNPTVSDVSILLADGATSLREGLSTSGLAVHRAEGSWSATEPGSMPLVTTHTARG